MKIGPRISDKTASWLLTHFVSKGAGAEYLLEAVPELYRRTVRDLRGRFTAGELSLMLDCMNSTMLMPKLASQQLVINCIDSMELDRTDAKWSVDRAGFTARLQALSLFESACLEIWARAFWESGAWQRDDGLEEWVSRLDRP